MNKKIILCVLIIIATVFTFNMCSNGVFNISSLAKLNEKLSSYEEKEAEISSQLETYSQNKQNLTVELNNYRDKKESYESMAEVSTVEEQVNSLLGEYYDLEYLWAVLGTYGVKEGVRLGFVCTTSSKIAESSDYIYADLNFTVVGEYKPICDFIEDCEDDDDLEFSISSFKLVGYEKMASDDSTQVANYLQATFTVKDVPLSADKLELINNQVEDGAELQNDLN